MSPYTIEMHTNTSGAIHHYGFRAYRNNGYSMPKGFITSYIAYWHIGTDEVYIEFSIQSPTGDASDHFRYSFPCLTTSQAKTIVDRQFTASKAMMEAYDMEMAVCS